MHVSKPLALLMVLAALAGCTPDGSGGITQTPFTPAAASGPLAPEEDCYTVGLVRLSTKEAADYYVKSMTSVGWKDVFTIEEKYSVPDPDDAKAPPVQLTAFGVCYGKFRTIEEVQGNLRQAKAYRAQNGQTVFFPVVKIIPGQDIGPAEYNLRNQPGPFHLVIALFQDDAKANYIGRKKFAVDFCKQLRQSGYEAYFLHVAGVSYVVLGSFGPDAVVVKPLVINPNESEDQVAYRIINRHQGVTIEFRDARILNYQKDFPRLAINGQGALTDRIMINPRTGSAVVDPKTHKPVYLPRPTYMARREGEIMTAVTD